MPYSYHQHQPPIKLFVCFLHAFKFSFLFLFIYFSFYFFVFCIRTNGWLYVQFYYSTTLVTYSQFNAVKLNLSFNVSFWYIYVATPNIMSAFVLVFTESKQYNHQHHRYRCNHHFHQITGILQKIQQYRINGLCTNVRISYTTHDLIRAVNHSNWWWWWLVCVVKPMGFAIHICRLFYIHAMYKNI